MKSLPAVRDAIEGASRRIAFFPKHICHARDSLSFTLSDYVRMQLMLRGFLMNGLIATQGIRRHLGRKLICKFQHFAITSPFFRLGIHLSRLSDFFSTASKIKVFSK